MYFHGLAEVLAGFKAVNYGAKKIGKFEQFCLKKAKNKR